MDMERVDNMSRPNGRPARASARVEAQGGKEEKIQVKAEKKVATQNLEGNINHGENSFCCS